MAKCLFDEDCVFSRELGRPKGFEVGGLNAQQAWEQKLTTQMRFGFSVLGKVTGETTFGGRTERR